MGATFPGMTQGQPKRVTHVLRHKHVTYLLGLGSVAKNPLLSTGEQVFDWCHHQPPPPKGATMGTMRILDQSGDTAVIWDLDDEATLRAAEEIFEREAAQAKMAFARPLGAPVEQAERIRSFDPTAEEIIWVRPIQGG
jgi:hypothetical protein